MKTSAPLFRSLLLASTLGFTLTACSTAPVTRNPGTEKRAPSSVSMTEVLNETNSIDQAVASVQVARMLGQRLQVFYSAENVLKQFDKELESGKGLVETENYPVLMAYWSVSHSIEDEIIDVYRTLLHRLATASKGSVAAVNARTLLRAFSDYSKAAIGSDRLALSSLGLEMNNVYEEYKEGLPKEDRQNLKGFRNILFKGKIGAFAKKVAAELSGRAASTTQTSSDDADLSVEVESLTRDYRASLHELQSLQSREPQAVGTRVFPTAGPHGSVSGTEWPKGNWSVTFDDGPHNSYSARVLANLKAHGFKSTFFELAQNATALPLVSKSLIDGGMELANHSYTHPQLPKLNAVQLHHEIVDANDKLTGVFGFKPTYFRCPYGAGLNVPRVRQMIADQNLIHVFWNVDSLDWQDHNPDSIVVRVKKQMATQGRGVILFHDIHPQSVTASNLIMNYIQATPGLRERTVGDVVNELNAQ